MPEKIRFPNMKGAATDSILLTFVKAVTVVLGLLVTKLLSTQFSLHEYGTYSQAMLVVSTVTSLSILGLTDATNYFYNATDNEELRQKKLATVFGLQYIIGSICAICVMLLYAPIIRYFNNEQLKSLIMFVAWMPLFENLLPMLQVLFVSIGKAKLIAVRNLIVSCFRLIIVIVACFVTQDIKTIFIILLLLDIVQVVYFMYVFGKIRFPIRLVLFRKKLIPGILKFSFPMAVYILTNALTRDIDKYIISYFTNIETLAIYTNAAKVLPFDLVTASFMTVLIPIITRQISAKNYGAALTTLKAYLSLGYLTTWIFAFGAVIVAKELMIFLYDAKYLPGLGVFIIYLFVDMIKFANTSLILTARGKTRTLMICSLVSLVLNFALSIIAYKVFGMIGPAVTTLVITFGLTIVLLLIGAREIHSNFFTLFEWRDMLVVILELLIVGTVTYIVKIALYRVILSSTVVLVMTYALFICVMLLLNKKRILSSLRAINKLK